MSTFEMPPPDIVDNFGTKWWLDKAASDYASRPDAKGVQLGAEVWLIEELNGARSFALVFQKRVIFESKNLKDIGDKIDNIKATHRI